MQLLSLSFEIQLVTKDSIRQQDLKKYLDVDNKVILVLFEYPFETLFLGGQFSIFKQSCSTSWFTQKEKCSTLGITILHHGDDCESLQNWTNLSFTLNFHFLLCVLEYHKRCSVWSSLVGIDRHWIDCHYPPHSLPPPSSRRGIFYCMRIAEKREPNVLRGICGRPSRHQITIDL